MKILAIVPARGGSKGIPKKNIYPLCGHPLIHYTLSEAKKSIRIDRVLLSSDDDEIIAVAKEYKVDIPFKRPESLSGDSIATLDVVKHAVNYLLENENYKPDYIFILQPTSPLRKTEHIDDSIDLLVNSDADSIVSVIKVPHSFNPYSVMQKENKFLKPFLPYDEAKNLRQFKPEFYARNGAAIYGFSYDCLIDKNSLYGDKILAYEMNKEDSIDIDDLFDLQLAEWILSDRKKKKNIL